MAKLVDFLEAFAVWSELCLSASNALLKGFGARGGASGGSGSLRRDCKTRELSAWSLSIVDTTQGLSLLCTCVRL